MKNYPFQIIVLAAGKGTRMNSNLPKVLHPLNGSPIIFYLLDSIQKSKVDGDPLIVVSRNPNRVTRKLGKRYPYATQFKRKGTGHAVAVCKKHLKGKAENVLVLYGDMPFVKPNSIKNLTETHLKGNCVLTMAIVQVPDFKGMHQGFMKFGRIVRNSKGKVERIVEFKDAANTEKKIKEVNPSYFCFKADWLWDNIDKIKNKNVQGEYYLTDLLEIAIKQGEEIETVNISPLEAIGVNTAEDLQIARDLLPSI